MRIRLEVNGKAWTEDVEPRRLLADVLRNDLRLTGTHLGCEHGICGACTVLVDDEAVRSCLMFAVQADGRRVTTVEGLADGEVLSALQRAFVEHRALQCGFCTPGLLMTGEALSRKGRDIPEVELIENVAGHVCRCTGYAPIVAALRDALGRTRARSER
jgi:aerobic-type carbon monoxide dehydrogenase small subunit (CoxS/CutS family)